MMSLKGETEPGDGEERLDSELAGLGVMLLLPFLFFVLVVVNLCVPGTMFLIKKGYCEMEISCNLILTSGFATSIVAVFWVV